MEVEGAGRLSEGGLDKSREEKRPMMPQQELEVRVGIKIKFQARLPC